MCVCGKCANISWNSLLPRILGRPGQGVVAVVDVAGASHGIEISLVLRYATIKKYREDRHAPQCQHYATDGDGDRYRYWYWYRDCHLDIVVAVLRPFAGRSQRGEIARRCRCLRRGAQLDELWKAIYILPLIFYLLLLMFSLGSSPPAIHFPPLSLLLCFSIFYLRMHELWIFPYGMRLACIQRTRTRTTENDARKFVIVVEFS